MHPKNSQIFFIISLCSEISFLVIFLIISSCLIFYFLIHFLTKIYDSTICRQERSSERPLLINVEWSVNNKCCNKKKKPRAFSIQMEKYWKGARGENIKKKKEVNRRRRYSTTNSGSQQTHHTLLSDQTISLPFERDNGRTDQRFGRRGSRRKWTSRRRRRWSWWWRQLELEGREIQIYLG